MNIGESRKITVERAHTGVLLDRQGGQVGIVHNIGCGARFVEELANDRRVTRRGIEQVRSGLPEPVVDDGERVGDHSGIRRDARVRGYSCETKQGDPAKADLSRTNKLREESQS